MKIAISGKGGVGKSTIAGALALVYSESGKRVLALDADPDANLAAALGFPEDIRQQIVPVSGQIKLIEERTGAKVNKCGQIFKLNPDVSDIAEKMAISYKDVSLLELGAVEQGGSGCACPENVFIRSLITDLILYKDDMLVMDMEAGVEHLGRATAKGVDVMLVVVEPGQRSIECAERVLKMSKQIGIPNTEVILNKVSGSEDRDYIKNVMPGIESLVVIPFSDEIRRSDQTGQSVISNLKPEISELFKNLAELILGKYSS